MRQTKFFRYPTISGPAGLLVVPKSLEHAHPTTFHLNNFMDILRHFNCTDYCLHHTPNTRLSGTDLRTRYFISMRIPTHREAQGLENLMTGQGNKETGNCPI